MRAGADEVAVEVVGIAEQEVAVGGAEHRVPIMLLRDGAGRQLPVPINSCEVLAIQVALAQHVVPRPLTHDLAIRLLGKLSGRLDRVVVDALSGHRSHATLHLGTSAGAIEMDASPGDAVALALRADAPVLVREEILAKATDGDDERG